MSKEFENRGYLGRGIAFPLRVNTRGELTLARGERDIQESIRIILETKPGERVMRPEFGCRAHELLFEPRNSATQTLMKQYVLDALRRWEPRIEVLAVNVYADSQQDGVLLVEIEYEIKPTHDIRSIVYPFFLVGEEGW